MAQAAAMQIQALGYRTDLLMHRFDGRVVDRGSYLVVETPTNPGFYWGNFLLFAAPPRPGDYEHWLRAFRREFAHEPAVRHVTFAWDNASSAPSAVEPFVEQGFLFEESVVLTARIAQPPPRPCPALVVRPLTTDGDWDAAVENQIACREEGLGLAAYRRFKARQMADYRKMAEGGMGHWYGAFLEGRLVGDLGIYGDGDLARFQSVGTHPDFRRRGICGSLVHEAARHALGDGRARTLVMVADPHADAVRIYKSLGFTVAEQQAGLCRWPVEDSA